MADVKISELLTTTDVSTGDYIPVVEGGVTKKVQAGPGGGLDAGTVSGFGIGTDNFLLPTSGVNLDNITKNGFYQVRNGAEQNNPFPGSESFIIHQNRSFYATQIGIKLTTVANDSQIKIRTKTAVGVWSAWATIWTSDTDGNGGQPPAPKPQGQTANASGFCSEYASRFVANGQTGGTYAVWAFNSSGAFLGFTAGRAQGFDLQTIWATCTHHAAWRTVA